MTDRVKYRPFTDDGDLSVRLTETPLALVLCQVRWPQFASLQTDDQLRELAPIISQSMPDYPLVSESRTINYLITPEGMTHTEAGSVCQWVSLDEAWHISLSRQFLSLYTTQYNTYGDMDLRLRATLKTLRETVGVRLINRVGVRYVNRLSSEEDMTNLKSILKPELLGYSALELPYLQSSTNQATYHVDDAVLQVRSGFLQPNQTVDPAIESLPNQSWVLDLDASQEVRQVLDVDAVAQLASRMSDLAYDYFKAVAAEGLKNREVGNRKAS
jgi:uncharacterized protein (TIGR04255 family)